jgi:hypothetical protein
MVLSTSKNVKNDGFEDTVPVNIPKGMVVVPAESCANPLLNATYPVPAVA